MKIALEGVDGEILIIPFLALVEDGNAVIAEPSFFIWSKHSNSLNAFCILPLVDLTISYWGFIMNQIILTIIIACIVTLGAPCHVNAFCKNKTHRTARNNKSDFICAAMSKEYYKTIGKKQRYIDAAYDGDKCVRCGCSS